MPYKPGWADRALCPASWSPFQTRACGREPPPGRPLREPCRGEAGRGAASRREAAVQQGPAGTSREEPSVAGLGPSTSGRGGLCVYLKRCLIKLSFALTPSRVSMETGVAAGTASSPLPGAGGGVLTPARRRGRPVPPGRVRDVTLFAGNRPRGECLFQETLQLLQVRPVLHGERVLTGHCTPHTTACHTPHTTCRHTPHATPPHATAWQGSERHRSRALCSVRTWPPEFEPLPWVSVAVS